MTAPTANACELVRLAVLPAHRHRGLGAALVRHVVQEATASELGWMDLALVAANTERPGALPSPLVDEPLAAAKGEQTAVFAGGCFWGVEAVFKHVKGVKSAVSGYAGGKVVSPTYEQVSSGATGHAESVRVVYDPSQVTYG